VNIYSVEFKAENRTLLKKALNEVKEEVLSEKDNYIRTTHLEINFIRKTATDLSRDPERAKAQRINKLKQTYSRFAVLEKAKAFKGAVRFKNSTKTKMQIVRYA